jgi:2Fe-2S ferredoxin
MVVVARTRKRDHVLDGRGTLMSRCLAAGLPVASACSGRGACGKCLVTVLRGAEGLTPPSVRETTTLTRNEATPGQRLSCQCRVPAGTMDLLVTTGYW